MLASGTGFVELLIIVSMTTDVGVTGGVYTCRLYTSRIPYRGVISGGVQIFVKSL